MKAHDSSLSYARRKRMKSSSFALPRQRKYPLDTLKRARNALARVAQHGTKQEQAIVKRKVHKKWPSIDIGK